MALVAFAWTLATVEAVAAQEPGVHLDPDSPAGQEYAIPLDSHRAAALGRDAADGAAQPLFGVGITPPAGASGGSRGSGGGGGGGGGGPTPAPGSGRAGRAPAGGSADRPPRTAALIELTRRRSKTFEVALAGVSVVLTGLLAGALIAVAARRRR